MRISDWSSDVCSSDLGTGHAHLGPHPHRRPRRHASAAFAAPYLDGVPVVCVVPAPVGAREHPVRSEGPQRAGGRLSAPPAARGRTAGPVAAAGPQAFAAVGRAAAARRSEEHTSELQSLMRISYAVYCLKKKKTTNNTT